MDNTQIVRAGYDAFQRGDIDALLSLLAENVEWISPTFGHIRGREAVRGYHAYLNRIFEYDRFDAEKFVAQNDAVVVLGAERVRQRETGRAAEYRWAHVFTVENGKITRLQIYADTAAIHAVLNESPAERAATLGPMGVTEPPYQS